ncbi:MAG: cytochrome b/b6 domain-containing protein [Betaproteobacteria bacterium]
MSPDDAPATATAAIERVLVWDRAVRVTHWVLVVLLVALLVSGLVGGPWLEWHMRFGQTLLAVVVFRVLWGFLGSRNARFRTFVRGPRAVASYARSRIARKPEIHVSHNPAGGWMALALLVALAVQACVGLFTNDGELWEGPLAQRVTQQLSDALSWFHRRFWWVIVALAGVHIAAVLAYLVVLRENLIVSMFGGTKAFPPGLARAEDGFASTVRALAVLALALALVFGPMSLAY